MFSTLHSFVITFLVFASYRPNFFLFLLLFSVFK
uniref:Uncharacterized protein n=1 Tax=Anguilla anguilla TaxID=7936 RepID=A0A0E9PVF8_ANGAN